MLEAVILVVALTTDAFVAAFAYGGDKIKIPLGSAVIINLICSGILAASLLAGQVISPYIPRELTIYFCFFILFFLGVTRLFDSSIKALIKKNNNLNKRLNFTMFNLRFILNIYADPEAADRDCSKELSPTEAASLAVALSLDGLAVGFGAGLASVSVIQVAAFSFVFGMTAVKCGCFAGNKIAEKLPLDFSWLSGLLLIILSVMKL